MGKGKDAVRNENTMDVQSQHACITVS